MNEDGASRPALVAVVAMARNRVIGKDGAMPWSIPTDLKRYRRLTMGKPMIMGRRTLDAIGRVLDGRDTIVLSRQEELPFEEAILVHSKDDALAAAIQSGRARAADEIVVAGGGEIYALFMDELDRLAITEVDAAPEGDACFPEIDEGVWEKIADEPCERGPKDTAETRFKLYRRRPS